MKIKFQTPYFRHLFQAIFIVILGLGLSSCKIAERHREPEMRMERTKETRMSTQQSQVPPGMMPEIQPRIIKIGVLVPLSGSNEKLGEAMLDAAQLAMTDIGKRNMVLVPIDSGKEPETAIKAMNRAIEQKVDIVLGPIFSSSTEAVAPMAKQAGINVISFSNDKNLAGDNVFLLGFMPEEQVRRIIKYSVGKGLRKFAGFAPNNEYGKLVMEEFRKSVIAEQGSITFADFYKSSNEAKVDLSKAAQINTETTQAAFIPEGGQRLEDIAALIDKNTTDKGKIQLLGSGQWDDPATTNIAELNGAWFVSTPPKLKADFEAHFKQIYHYMPPRITSLAYDGVALVAHLSSGPEGPDFSAAALTNPRGFSGVNGIFRFRANGISERGLTIMEIKSGSFEEMEPAPDNFINF